MEGNLRALAGFRLFLPLVALATAGPVQAQTYYRLDAGYSKSLNADIKDQNPDLPQICGDNLCSPGTLQKALGGSSVLSAGVGSRFGTNMRADVTLGYRGGYKLDDSDQNAPPLHFKAEVKSLALMANVYRDFPLARLTPYLGAGLGVAQNKMGTISLDDGTGNTGTAPGGTKISPAFAFMAGATFPLGGTTLDVGYRFADLGKIESSTGDFTFGGVVLTLPYAGVIGRLRAHELTIGLRY
jgi:opacity protein-like surface antigen